MRIVQLHYDMTSVEMFQLLQYVIVLCSREFGSRMLAEERVLILNELNFATP